MISQDLVAEISGATLWRRLSNVMPSASGDIKAGSFLAIGTSPTRPDPSSIFTNASWEGAPQGTADYVISADEKTSIQARRRKQPTLPSGPTARHVSSMSTFGKAPGPTGLGCPSCQDLRRCEIKIGIAPVDRLVGEVMTQEPS